MSSHHHVRDSKGIHDFLARGGVVCTSTQRLARELRHAYDLRMEQEGRSAWPAARVQAFGSWLAAQVEQHLLFGESGALQQRRLLTPAQEALTWEHAIVSTGRGDEVLQTEALSAMMMEAHALEHAWFLPEDALRRSRSEGSAAYLHVREHVHEIWDEKQFLPASMLPRLAVDILRVEPDRLPPQFMLAGFDLLPDAALQAFQSLHVRHRSRLAMFMPSPADGSGLVLRYADLEEELYAAAQWCRKLLQQGENGIAVVLPSLDRMRASVDTIFGEVLSPGVTPDTLDDRAPYELSLGTRCADEGVLAAAQWAVELMRPAVPTDALSAILRSTYFNGAEKQRQRRAVLELRLRRTGVEALRLRDFRSLLRDEHRQDDVVTAMGERRPMSGTRSAAEWVKEIDGLLHTLGWPGDLPLSSREYQAVRRWEALLVEMASFDAVLPPMTVTEMLSRLRRMLSERIFQPESHLAPVQVMGVLETAGLSFRHARIIGMNEELWPPPSRVHPFHPLAVQRAAGITEALPERYLAQMRTMTKRIAGLAPAAVLSCSRNEGDRELLLSPLLREYSVRDCTLSRSTYISDMQGMYPASMEDRPEESELPLQEKERIRGGVRVLTLQAACPFRAFAELRLRTDEPETPEAGVRPLDRGSLLHGVLDKIWELLQSSDALCRMADAEMDAVIDDAIMQTERAQETMRSATYPSHVRIAERACAKAIVREWLLMERERPAFTVAAREKEEEGVFGPLRLRLRIDRVDRLADGSRLLIDYKTGWHRPSEWMDARPAQPQLPMYALAAEETPSGIAFGVLQRGGCAYSGLVRDAQQAPMLEDVKHFMQANDEEHGDWDTLLEKWRETLRTLAEDFTSGTASVDPRDGAATCRFCSLQALCRIHEKQEEGDHDA
jgi:ATP-dependent helicase/nuclease subunit B